VNTGFCYGDLRERAHLGDFSSDGGVILKMDLQEVGWGDIDCTDVAQDSEM
jgi:hypothetical protein